MGPIHFVWECQSGQAYAGPRILPQPMGIPDRLAARRSCSDWLCLGERKLARLAPALSVLVAHIDSLPSVTDSIE